MNAYTIKKEIDHLSKDEITSLLTEVMPALCRELMGEEQCRNHMMEVFGIDCVEELEKRFEAAV